MESKHTPGPWRFEATTKTIRAVPSNYWLASMDSWDGAVDNAANSRLIAAAPDLLAALERVISASGPFNDSHSPYWTLNDDDISAARAAIARARGE